MLYQLTRDLPEKELDQAVAEFVKFMARHRAFRRLDRIIAAYEVYAREQDGAEDITLVSARPLPEALAAKVVSHFGRGGKIETIVDETLIGGLIVKTRRRVLDASVKTQLRGLKNDMLAD
ncbi:MAG: ATP synthase subunit delta [Candidatus Magasanikbacteria bacterium GW2011_GWA2_56_11]|uniref:ATP synthase subunit delta n=1 Tax=Candidatus Magasanikbacteria bacterium GW2011_GWA2_56_11 TaxID=1619044 RepID=A0A0G1YGW2_9BACT|nr:MAG: ATP synthase subunit delta [Candidatus Magasanikbacteria bacterium GW2011_GWA2_56_11]